MKRVKKNIKTAQKKGVSNVDFLKMREIAKRECEKMEKEATEKALLYMLAIPLNILFHDYWQKSAKKRAPQFIEEVMKYYLSVQEGYVTDKELADLLYDLAGVKIEAEWLERVKNEHV